MENLSRVWCECLPVAWYCVQEVLRKSMKSGTMEASGGDETDGGATSGVLPPGTLACTHGPGVSTFQAQSREPSRPVTGLQKRRWYATVLLVTLKSGITKSDAIINCTSSGRSTPAAFTGKRRRTLCIFSSVIRGLWILSAFEVIRNPLTWPLSEDRTLKPGLH